MTDELDLAVVRQHFAELDQIAGYGNDRDAERDALYAVVADAVLVIAEVERLRALRPATSQAVMDHMTRADAAEAAIARVRALADFVESRMMATARVSEIRAALDGEGGE